ncbi:hypothetical protein AMTRI_Chr08g164190 [Amborella trichopoda]
MHGNSSFFLQLKNNIDSISRVKFESNSSLERSNPPMVTKDYNQEGIANEYKKGIAVKPMIVQSISIFCYNELVSGAITYKNLGLFRDLKICAFQMQSEVPNMSLRHTLLVNRGEQSHSSRQLRL